jgi:hypothetical protein
MSENGSHTVAAPNAEASGAVTSNEATKKHPKQGKFNSGINKKVPMKVDVNKHGIRRETSMQPKKVGRKKV